MRTLLPYFKEDPLSVSITPGTITLQQTTKKAPLSINQWTTCFHIFMSVFLEKKLDEALHLLKYCEFIRELQHDHGDSAWRYYDEAFRRLRETLSAPWQVPIEELRAKAISQNFKQKYNNQTQNSKGNYSQSFRSSQPKTCFMFNRGEICQNKPCPYKHVCAICKSDTHNRRECYKNRNNTGQTSTQSKRTPTSSSTSNSSTSGAANKSVARL